MKTFRKDYNYGIECEDKVLEILNKNFNIDGEIRKSNSIYSSYDFISNNYCYELKSRNNRYDEYPTTLIPKYKCNRDNLYLLFYFTDGLYYIKYDKDLFETFEVKQFKRNDRVDKIQKPVDYYYIPVEHLTRIEYVSCGSTATF
jgi:hypothetical protein